MTVLSQIMNVKVTMSPHLKLTVLKALLELTMTNMNLKDRILSYLRAKLKNLWSNLYILKNN